jgi:hypothetical protein
MFGKHKDKEKPEHKFDAEYIGGHKLYPKKKGTDVHIFADRIVLKDVGPKDNRL